MLLTIHALDSLGYCTKTHTRNGSKQDVTLMEAFGEAKKSRIAV